MYEVNYIGRTSYVSCNFHRRIRREGLLCDAERGLLAIAKFLVRSTVTRQQPWNFSKLDSGRPRSFDAIAAASI